MSSEDVILLRKANKKIADLREDIHRLSNELKKKYELHGGGCRAVQTVGIVQRSPPGHSDVGPLRLSAALLLHAYPLQSSWTEVVVRGYKRDSDWTASSPRLSLSNRYTVLSDDNPTHPTADPAAPSPSDLDPKIAPANTAAGGSRVVGILTTFSTF